MATGRRYHGYAAGTNTVSTTAPLSNQVSATTVRPKVYEFIIGSDATPADTGNKFSLQRTTANFGTPSAVTPNPLDPADPASLCLFSKPGGTAPTITANSDMLWIAINGRANFRWVASPDGEIGLPATAANGLCLTSVVATTAQNWAWSQYWSE